MSFRDVLITIGQTTPVVTNANFNDVCNRIIKLINKMIGHGISATYADKVANEILPNLNPKSLTHMLSNAKYRSTDPWSVDMVR